MKKDLFEDLKENIDTLKKEVKAREAQQTPISKENTLKLLNNFKSIIEEVAEEYVDYEEEDMLEIIDNYLIDMVQDVEA